MSHLYKQNSTAAVLQFQKCCLCTGLRLAKALTILVQELVKLLLQWRERELFVLLRMLFHGAIALPHQ